MYNKCSAASYSLQSGFKNRNIVGSAPLTDGGCIHQITFGYLRTYTHTVPTHRLTHTYTYTYAYIHTPWILYEVIREFIVLLEFDCMSKFAQTRSFCNRFKIHSYWKLSTGGCLCMNMFISIFVYNENVICRRSITGDDTRGIERTRELCVYMLWCERVVCVCTYHGVSCVC